MSNILCHERSLHTNGPYRIRQLASAGSGPAAQMPRSRTCERPDASSAEQPAPFPDTQPLGAPAIAAALPERHSEAKPTECPRRLAAVAAAQRRSRPQRPRCPLNRTKIRLPVAPRRPGGPVCERQELGGSQIPSWRPAAQSALHGRQGKRHRAGAGMAKMTRLRAAPRAAARMPRQTTPVLIPADAG